MRWNIAAECVSVIILCIIWVYSRRGSMLPTLKNKLFQGCFLLTFLAMTSNILSTILLYYYQMVPLFLNWAVSTVYFIATPLMGVIYFYYTVSILYENHSRIPRFFSWCSLPALAYLVLVVINPITKSLFNITRSQGYTQGRLIFLTYLIFYIYCLGCVVFVLIRRRDIDRPIRRILIAFPLIAALVIAFQSFFPSVVLTGSAATCALLLLYLYLQNKQISVDHLTGLSNRQELQKMIQLKIKKNVPFTLVVLSLRGFKHINDKFGQHTGDALLQAIAAYLRENVGAYRTFRFSGDEFAAFFDDEAQTESFVRALLARSEQPFLVNGLRGRLPIVIGLARYPDSASSVEGLTSGIEYAVIQAKKGHDSSVCYCTPDMLRQVARRRELLELLRERTKNNAFDVYIQPIFDIKKGAFTMGEALLRLNGAPMGAVYPSEFIPLAESAGLIVEMTYQTLGRVCAFIRRLLDRGVDIDGISVNFSAIQFSQPELADRVCAIIAQHGIPCSKIKIEITESVLVEKPDIVNEFIRTMREKGVRIALDDFGTGYCNLVSVTNLPLNALKIDKSLLWSAMESEKSAIMLRSIVSVMQQLGMRTVVEGVETAEQDRLVRDAGCDMIQGFLYAKPMPQAQAETVMGTRPAEVSV